MVGNGTPARGAACLCRGAAICDREIKSTRKAAAAANRFFRPDRTVNLRSVLREFGDRSAFGAPRASDRTSESVSLHTAFPLVPPRISRARTRGRATCRRLSNSRFSRVPSPRAATMATAWLIEAGDDDLLDLGELSPVAPEKRPTATLDVSPLGEISPVDANRQRVPAARAGSKPFPFAPSPAVKGATRAATSATAAFPRSPAFAPSPLAPKRAAQREPTKNSPGTLAGAAPAPAQAPSPIFKPPLGGSRATVAAAEPVPRRRPSAAEPPRGGGLSRHSRRQSLGLDAFQSISKGLLEEDDDFDFAPSFTPKAAKGPGAFAPSPVREEEEDVAEEEAAVEEAKAGALEEIVEEEEEEAAAEAAVEPAAEPDAPAAARARRVPPLPKRRKTGRPSRWNRPSHQNRPKPRRRTTRSSGNCAPPWRRRSAAAGSPGYPAACKTLRPGDRRPDPPRRSRRFPTRRFRRTLAATRPATRCTPTTIPWSCRRTSTSP